MRKDIVVHASTEARHWYGFTLKPGHYYGRDQYGFFATSDRRQTGDMAIWRGRVAKGGNIVKWHKLNLKSSAPLVQHIRAFQILNPVQFDPQARPERKQSGHAVHHAAPSTVGRQTPVLAEPVRSTTAATWCDLKTPRKAIPPSAATLALWGEVASRVM